MEKISVAPFTLFFLIFTRHLNKSQRYKLTSSPHDGDVLSIRSNEVILHL